jgi:hypothetical protein
MASKYDPMMVPDVEHTVAIEERIGMLQKEIEERCSALQRRIGALSVSSKGREAMKLKTWQGKVTRIREAHSGTFSIDDLHGLLRESDAISLELDRLSKGQ